MALIVTAPILATNKFTGTKVSLPEGARVHLHKGGLLWGLRPESIKCKVFIPDNPDDLRILLSEDKQVLDHSQEEATHRLFSRLHDIDSLEPLETNSMQRKMYDIGHENDWPYLHNTSWMKNINRQLKHPSLLIEKVHMQDGWHLVVVLYTTW